MSDVKSWRRCSDCREMFPSTNEHFYQVNKAKPERLDPKCKRCRCAAVRASHQRRKEMDAAGIVPPKLAPGTKHPTGRPLGWRKPKPDAPPPPARCHVPPGLPRLTTWRGPVPQGYGVAA